MNKKKKFGPLILFDYKPTVIAEAGVNHMCNIKLALKYVKDAKDGFADAIKFQFYTGDSLVSRVQDADRNAHFKSFELSNRCDITFLQFNL